MQLQAEEVACYSSFSARRPILVSTRRGHARSPCASMSLTLRAKVLFVSEAPAASGVTTNAMSGVPDILDSACLSPLVFIESILLSY